MSVSLNSTLHNMAESLAVQTRCIEVAGQNMAYSQSSEYAARKIRVSPSTFGNGMSRIQSTVTTERSELLDRQILASIMQVSELKSADQMNQSIESLLGERFQTNPSGTSEQTTDFGSTGLSNDINQFFVACNGLAANSQNATYKTTLIQKADTVVKQLQTLDSRLKAMDSRLDDELGHNVTKANILLSQIADLNDSILRFELPNPGKSALELRESRQSALEELAKHIDFEIRETGNFFQVVTMDSTDNEIVLVDSMESKALAYDKDTETISVGGTELMVNGGSLSGLLDTKKAMLPAVRKNLNDWTKTFVENVNKAYNATRDTGSIDPTKDFFDNDGITIDTITLKVTSSTLRTSSKDEAPLANDLIQKLSSLAETKIPELKGQTIAKGYSSFITQLAEKFNATTAEYNKANVVLKDNIQKRQNIIGVSMDEELTYLMRSQKAFQAAAKVITTIDELMQTVIHMKR